MMLLPNTNLHFMGFRKDRNGNAVVKLRIEGHKGFSIQTNGNMPTVHSNSIRVKKYAELTKDDLLLISNEVVRHIRQFGTDRQNAILECKNDDKFYAKI